MIEATEIKKNIINTTIKVVYRNIITVVCFKAVISSETFISLVWVIIDNGVVDFINVEVLLITFEDIKVILVSRKVLILVSKTHLDIENRVSLVNLLIDTFIREKIVVIFIIIIGVKTAVGCKLKNNHLKIRKIKRFNVIIIFDYDQDISINFVNIFYFDINSINLTKIAFISYCNFHLSF